MNYKICKQVIAHLEKEEEEYDIKYTDYCINVTNNKGGDGTALLQEYYQCKYQCEKLEKIEEKKQKQQEEEEEEKKKKKNQVQETKKTKKKHVSQHN